MLCNPFNTTPRQRQDAAWSLLAAPAQPFVIFTSTKLAGAPGVAVWVQMGGATWGTQGG